MSVTTVRLQAEVEQRLEAIASRLHRSKSWVINQALSEYIEKQQLEQEQVELMNKYGLQKFNELFEVTA